MDYSINNRVFPPLWHHGSILAINALKAKEEIATTQNVLLEQQNVWCPPKN